MQLKLIFSCTIIFFYFTGANANKCKKPNEIYSNEENRCESACTYKELINYQSNKSSCICNDGFARNKDGNCVEPKSCENFCGVNEHLDKEAIKKKAPCSKYCSCKEGFYRLEKECVKCEYSSKEKDRCEIFSSKTCSCTKCKIEYKYCKGHCLDNHLNCRTYDAIETCQCINCETGYKNLEGRCVKDVAHCDKYDENGKCVTCEKGRTFCNNNCVLNNCIGGTILDLSLCICVCPPHTELCGAKCVKPVCNNPWEYFCSQTCECECKEGAFSCQDSCYPLVNHCTSYKNDTCKCEYCNPGYKLCNENCAPFKCNVNEYFVDAICQCDCKDGFFRNEKGECSSTETNIEYSIFHKLFLEIIYRFLPLGYGFCHTNEFYSSWAIKYEETCQGPRTPLPTERCFCKNGFIRDKTTNTCMKVCPLQGNPCVTHEVYECGPERYCKKKSLVKADVAVAVDLPLDLPLCLNKDVLGVDLEIGKSSNTTTADSKDIKKKDVDSQPGNTDFKLVDADVELLPPSDSDKVKKNEEGDILDLGASVKRVASVDLEVGGTTKESKKNENTTDPENGELLGTSVRRVASVDLEVRGTTQEPEKKENTTDPENGDLLDAKVDLGIGNENILLLLNEEFCGYHCSEGYGRYGSVCKKCDT